MRWPRGRCPWAAVATLAVVLMAGPAAAHPLLQASDPADGGALPEGASVLALRFSERIDDAHAGLRLTGPNGSVPATAAFPSARPHDMRALTAPLAAGTYQADWYVLGVDGHRTEGSIRFAVAGEASPSGAGSQGPGTGVAVVEGAARALMVGALCVLVGAPVFAAEVAQVRPLPARLRRTLAWTAVVGLAGSAALAWALTESHGGSLLGSSAGRSLLGKSALLASAGAGLVAAARRDGRDVWAHAAAVAAFLALVMHSMGGHGLLAFGSTEGAAAHIAMTIHLLATALWLGGVVAFLEVARDLEAAGVAELVSRFTPLAVLSVALVAATGIYEAVVHVPLGVPWRGAYVGLLAAKVALLAVLVAFGGVHVLVLRPRLVRGGGALAIRRVLRAEVMVMVGTLVVAGVLAATPSPLVPADGSVPERVWEWEAPLGDFHARIAIGADPVRAGAVVGLSLELRSTTSIPVDQASPRVLLTSPDGAVHDVAWSTGAPGTWQARLDMLDAPGRWRVDAQAQGKTAQFPLTVLP